MAARGPDAAGLWHSEDRTVGLAHRRLSIIDLTPAANQPFTDARGNTIVFNGEIYNFRDLRQRQKGRGYRFRTESDTEVLLALYAEHGQEMVHHLRGMFAFAIWDPARRGLFLARDHFGLKPLYYADDGAALRFASQVKALSRGNVRLEPDFAGHAGFLLWGHVPTPFTLHKSIRGLPAGTRMWVRDTGPARPEPFFDLTAELATATAAAPSVSPQTRRDIIHEALRDTVKHHMVSDVPVGIFLSAGTDSSVIAALASSLTAHPLRAVTLGFAEWRGTPKDEVPGAAEVARRIGAVHSPHWISQDEFVQELPRITACMDQPSIDGVNTYFASKLAAKNGLKVVLSGLGGDEMFGGYSYFTSIPRMVGWLRKTPLAHNPGLGRAVRASLSPWLGFFASKKLAGAMEYADSLERFYLLNRCLHPPWELAAGRAPDWLRAGLEELRYETRLKSATLGIRCDRAALTALEMTFYMRNQVLRDADWAGMAHGLEIRVPFVDLALFRSLAPLLATADPPSKADMLDAAAGLLPVSMGRRRKTGFSVPMHRVLPKRLLPRRQGDESRAWADLLHRGIRPAPRFLSLVTDAFGGHGGIAQFNRDFLGALAGRRPQPRIVALPRIMPNNPGRIPPGIEFDLVALGGKLRFVLAVVRQLLRDRKFQLVHCGHINLLPVAFLAKLWTGAPIILVLYGFEAWLRPRWFWLRWLAPRADAILTISRLTYSRFAQWASPRICPAYLLPTTVDLSAFTPGPKDDSLLSRYGLHGRKVILTVGRMDSRERMKGFDEVIEAMPAILRHEPTTTYLVVGDGPDRGRLERKVSLFGLSDRVVFAGLVPEDEKVAHYRLADAYIMPGCGEGFGIVFLEAIACGLPVVGSKIDGSREALRHGRLGRLVDPTSRDDIVQAALAALGTPRLERSLEGVRRFGMPVFQRRLDAIISRVLSPYAKTSARLRPAAQKGVRSQ
jgi:asparagine synthase (glutamine-hydrolysing)